MQQQIFISGMPDYSVATVSISLYRLFDIRTQLRTSHNSLWDVLTLLTHACIIFNGGQQNRRRFIDLGVVLHPTVPRRCIYIPMLEMQYLCILSLLVKYLAEITKKCEPFRFIYLHFKIDQQRKDMSPTGAIQFQNRGSLSTIIPNVPELTFINKRICAQSKARNVYREKPYTNTPSAK